MNKDKKKIGFALGGGGARGLSHIGVLKVLDEYGIVPDIISGTSIGAIIGALYSGGHKPAEIEQLVLGLNWKKLVSLVDVTLPVSGFFQGKRLVSLLKSIIGDLTFQQLQYAFSCVATDIISGEQVVLKEGSLIEAVRASISLPGIFTPVSISGRFLVDGGLINTVPVSVCRDMGADYVVGVNVIPNPSRVMCDPDKNPQYPVCDTIDPEICCIRSPTFCIASRISCCDCSAFCTSCFFSQSISLLVSISCLRSSLFCSSSSCAFFNFSRSLSLSLPLLFKIGELLIQ